MDEFAFQEDMQKELNDFKEEIYQKVKDFSCDLQATTVRLMELEQSTADVEEWNGAAGDTLLGVTDKTSQIQAKLIDLEARSGWNISTCTEPRRARREVICWSL